MDKILLKDVPRSRQHRTDRRNENWDSLGICDFVHNGLDPSSFSSPHSLVHRGKQRFQTPCPKDIALVDEGYHQSSLGHDQLGMIKVVELHT